MQLSKLIWMWMLAFSAVGHVDLYGGEPAPPLPDKETTVERLIQRGCRESREGKFLESLDTFRRAVRLGPENPEPRYCLGTALIAVWRYDEARKELNRALDLDRWCVSAMIWLASCEMYDMEYVRAFRWLRMALLLAPEHPDALAVLAHLLLDIDELELARDVIEHVLAKNPRHGIAKTAKGNLKMLRKDPEAASKEFDFLLREDPGNIQAYIGMAQVLCRKDRPKDAIRLLDRAVKVNPFPPSLYAWRGYVLHRMKRVWDAVAEYRKALDIDPEYAGGHHLYSFCPGTAREESRPAGKARRLLEESLRAMERGDLPMACRRAGEATALAPRNLLAWLVRGSVSYCAENHETVMECARRAVALDGKAPLPHILFDAGWKLRKECKKQELTRRDFHDRFLALPAPELPGIGKVFRNYRALNEDGKKVVRRAVGPFRRFLPVLEKKGATYYFLPLHEHITKMPGMSPWKGKKTFDGRYWGGVRGASGIMAVTGMEEIWQTTRMGFSTVAHEFAHLVHYFALSEKQNTRITELYKKAKKTGRCLDYYAAENDKEYFAQGYEAFISLFKRPTISETEKNTRDDLEKKDPDLFRFLVKLCTE